MTFVLKSQDTSWFNGTGRVWFEDESLEILTPWPAMPLTDSEDGSQIGLQSWMPVDRRFDEPETCILEYACSELNMTIGPLTFLSNEFQILYQDSYGRTIESTGGHLNT
jgi:hypothetical protein